MLRKISLFIKFLPVVILLTACEEEEPLEPNTFAYVSIHNASIIPGTPATTQKPVNLFVDNKKMNNAGVVTYNSTIPGTNIGVTGGSHTISIKDTASSNPVEYFTGNINVETGKNYSAFLYDTVNAGKVKVLFLNTSLTAPANTSSNIRFLNLSPNTTPVDVWIFKSTTDSVKVFSAVPYVGATPDAAALSAFTTVPSGSVTIRTRAPGSNTNITSTAFTLANGKIYTLFLRGLSGTGKTPAIGLSSVMHN